jgi:hypothetical protein
MLLAFKGIKVTGARVPEDNPAPVAFKTMSPTSNLKPTIACRNEVSSASADQC